MISPGFFGLYNAHRGIIAAQSALNTINHNVANANTPGFTRQRIDLASMPAYQYPTNNVAMGAFGQIGQGVSVEQVNRIRDAFLDGQFRLQNAGLGRDTNTAQVMKTMEGILAEPTEDGINAAMQRLFDAANQMALRPESTAARTDFIQQAEQVVNIFQNQAKQLSDLRQNLVGDAAVPGSFNVSELAINVKQVNEKLATLAQVNLEINTVVASGARPNDLFDKRDQLLDELSKLVDIQVDPTANSQINVSIGGQLLLRGVTQVGSLQVVANTNVAPATPLPDDTPSFVQAVLPTGTVTLNNNITSGVVGSILTMGGNTGSSSTIRGVLGGLDTLVTTVVNTLNGLQAAGRDLNGNLGAANPLFQFNASVPATAMNIFRYQVNPAVLADRRLIAAAINDTTIPTGQGAAVGGVKIDNYAGPGDNRNAQKMADLWTTAHAALGQTTFTDYFNTVLSKLGIDSKAYEDRGKSQTTLVNSLEQRRQSVGGVNVDEEMIDMIRFQRGFEASSRVLKTFDDIYQQLIRLGE